MPESVQTYWQTLLERVDKPSARKLLAEVDTSHPLGWRQPPKQGPAASKRIAAPPMTEFFLKMKTEYPYYLALVRVRLVGPRPAPHPPAAQRCNAPQARSAPGGAWSYY